MINDLVTSAPSDEALCFLGAGPLEELLDRHGDAFVARAAQLAEQQATFRIALSCVWLGSAPLATRKMLAPYIGEIEG
jgi:hypothetical protein